MMKLLTLIVHREAQQDLLDLLMSHEHVRGFTTTRGEGHSCRTQHNPFETDRDRVLGYVPRVRVDVLLPEEHLPGVLDLLRGCESCVSGLGIWWVTTVDDSGYL